MIVICYIDCMLTGNRAREISALLLSLLIVLMVTVWCGWFDVSRDGTLAALTVVSFWHQWW